MQPGIKNSIESSFGHKIRIRSCGILIEDDKVLLIKHLGLGELGEFWSFPGGGIHPNENLEQALIREFKEETNLTISIKEFAFATEFIEKPLHAIEFYFFVEKQSGDLKLGIEPEMQGISILSEFNWFGIPELNDLDFRKKPKFLKNIRSYEQLKNLINFGRY
jgi:8-oxo-dGTP diphosphatase